MGPQSRVSSVKFPGPKYCTIYSMIGWPDLNLTNPRYSPHRGSNQRPLEGGGRRACIISIYYRYVYITDFLCQNFGLTFFQKFYLQIIFYLDKFINFICYLDKNFWQIINNPSANFNRNFPKMMFSRY